MDDKQSQRIARILGMKECEDVFDEALDVTEETLEVYFQYLKKKVQYPCQLTCIDCFGWEEYYLYGPGDQDKYEELKKSQACHTDTFDLIDFEEVDLDEGILVTVQRLSDKQNLTVPLANLETVEKDSGNCQLLNDYSVWFANFLR